MTEVKQDKPKKRMVELPPQKSAADTSNWENRDISAVMVNLALKKRIVRDLEFVKPKDDKLQALTLEQIQRLHAKEQAKKSR